jgi:hypothetical protein
MAECGGRNHPIPAAAHPDTFAVQEVDEHGVFVGDPIRLAMPAEARRAGYRLKRPVTFSTSREYAPTDRSPEQNATQA